MSLPYYDRVVIAVGDGAGNFSRSIEVAGTDGVSSVYPGDPNADGKVDLLVTFVADGGVAMQMFYGDGTGQFSTTPP